MVDPSTSAVRAVAHDGEVPFVDRNFPLFPVCNGNSISLVTDESASATLNVVPVPPDMFTVTLFPVFDFDRF